MAVGGLDIGTSGCKFVAYDIDGKVLCESKYSYREYGTDGIREIDPNEVWEAVVVVLGDSKKHCPESIEALAITTLGESAVILDMEGRALCNSMVTGDKRGINECAQLDEQFGKEALMKITGIPLSEMYALPKFIWLKKHTDVLQRAKYLFLYEDYITYRLTGNRAVSYSSASRTMAFDINKKEWSWDLLAVAGLTPSMMSEPIPSGTIIGRVSAEAAYATGLSADTIIVAGGHDQMCAAFGSGVVSNKECGDGMGTCEVMTAFLDDIQPDSYMINNELACVPYVFPDTFLTYLVMTNCGILMNWYRDTFFEREYLREDINSSNMFNILDGKTENNPTSMLVIPNFGSAGNPHVDYSAKGTIWGVTIHTKQHELFRAFKEGMAYHMKLCLESVEPLGIMPKSIRSAGGGARSDITLQIRADILGTEICRLEQMEAGSLGCMMLAATAIGKYSDLREAANTVVKIGKSFYPSKQNQERYTELYEKYKRLYEMTRDFK